MTDQAILQQARNIVADKFVAIETKRVRPAQYTSFEAWGRHIDDYSRFMREGAYDNDLAVVATIAALEFAAAAQTEGLA